MDGYALGQAMTVGVGVIAGTLTNGLEGLEHSLEISLGNFNLDENSFWGGVLQGISRHTWESPQTIIGHAYSHWRNSMGNVDRVDFLGGATFVTQENAGGNGVTFGNFININNYEKIIGDFATYVIGQKKPLYMHEYGHTIDSRLFGPLYLPVIGVPSASNVKNKRYWTELRANQAAFRYFGKYYGLKEWNYPDFPLH